MRTMRSCNATVDSNMLTVVEGLAESICNKFSPIVDAALWDFLISIGYTDGAEHSPEKLVQIMANLKSRLDGVPYTTAEILDMIKRDNFSRKVITQKSIKEQLATLNTEMDTLEQVDADVNAAIKKYAAIAREEAALEAIPETKPETKPEAAPEAAPTIIEKKSKPKTKAKLEALVTAVPAAVPVSKPISEPTPEPAKVEILDDKFIDDMFSDMDLN
jgi:hypothetical protein